MARDDDVQRLLDEQAILRTMNRYCHAMDYGLDQEWIDLFTPDGVFDVFDTAGKTIHRENGRDDLARYIGAYPRSASVYRKHLMLQPVVTIDGDTARSQSYWVLLTNDNGGLPRVGAYGRYRDTLLKVDGEWRIAERLAEVEATSYQPPPSSSASDA